MNFKVQNLAILIVSFSVILGCKKKHNAFLGQDFSTFATIEMQDFPDSNVLHLTNNLPFNFKDTMAKFVDFEKFSSYEMAYLRLHRVVIESTVHWTSNYQVDSVYISISNSALPNGEQLVTQVGFIDSNIFVYDRKIYDNSMVFKEFRTHFDTWHESIFKIKLVSKNGNFLEPEKFKVTFFFKSAFRGRYK